MEIRPVVPTEYDALGALTLASFEDIEGAGELGDYARTLRNVADRAERALVLVAVDGPKLLGGVTYVDGPTNPYSEDLREGDAGIRMLAVAGSAQGQGVGRALTQACIDQARIQGAARVALHSTPWMVVAHRLYASMGFTRVAERDVDVTPDLRLMGFVLHLR